MDLTAQPDQPTFRPPPSLEALVDERALDAELAALLGLLVERRVPLLVCGDVALDRRRPVLEALLESLPTDVRRIPLAGPTEDYAWLPEAGSLGWRADGPTPGRVPLEPATPAETVIEAGDLDAHGAHAAWAGVIRIAVRAVSLGYGFAATTALASLEAVLERLRWPPYRLTEDELSRLGVVVVVGERAGGAAGPIVTAAHYLRPVARDMHGHVQKLGPAVLATGDPATGRFEHFAWGVTPELAVRMGQRAGDLEIELDRRRAAFERATAGAANGGGRR